MASTTETIRIVISEQGSSQTAAGINKVAKEATAADKALGLLKVGLAALGVGSLIHEYVELSNTYQEIQNRIKLVTSSSSEQAAVSSELLRIANATLTPLEATAELYSRIAFNSRNLGLSQEQVLRITQTLNEATIISGVNAREAKSAVIELTHGLAEGTLHGYQLRSILAQVPFVADLIARHMHVSADAIRALGAEGKLTSKDITEAFLEAGASVDEKFARIVPTIGQAFTVLSNNILGTVGDFNSTTGAAAAVAQAILSIASTVDDVIVLIEELASLAKTGLEQVGDAIDAVFGTKVQNSKVTFRDFLRFVAAGIDGFVGLFVGAGGAIVEFFTTVFSNLKGIFERVINGIGFGLATAINFIIRGLNAALQGVADSANRVIDLANQASEFVGGGKVFDKIEVGKFDEVKFNALRETALVKADQLGKNVATAFKDGFNSSSGANEFLDDVFRKSDARKAARTAAAAGLANTKVPGGGGGESKSDLEFDKLREQLLAQQELLALDQKRGQLQFDQAQAVLTLHKSLEKSNVHLSEQQTTELEGLAKANAERKIRNTLDVQTQEFSRTMQEQLDLLNLNTQAREVETKLLPVINAYKKAGIDLDTAQLDLLRQQAQALQDKNTQEQVRIAILGDQAKIQAELNAANSLHSGGGISDEQLRRFQLQKDIEAKSLDPSALAGFQTGLDQLELKVTDFASIANQTITDAFSGAEDALVHFVQTGEFSFSSLVDSMIADLTRLLARQAIAGLLNVVSGGSAGAAVSLFSVAGAKAAGGPVSSGQSYLVGERGPEIFQPPSNGSIVPNNQLGGVAGASPNVTIVNVLDPGMVSAALADPRNQQVIVNGITSGSNGAAMKKRLGVR